MDTVREGRTSVEARWGIWDFVYCFFVFPVLGATLSLLVLLALSTQYRSFWIFLPPAVLLIASPPVAGFLFRKWRRGRQRAPRLAGHIALGVLPLLFVVVAALSYSGFCLKERRYLSDEEKIRAAMRYVERTNIEVRFPDCCRIVPGGGDYHPPTFWSRLLGGVSDLIEIKYVRRFTDDLGVPQTESVRQVLYISPCGRVDNTFFTSFFF